MGDVIEAAKEIIAAKEAIDNAPENIKASTLSDLYSEFDDALREGAVEVARALLAERNSHDELVAALNGLLGMCGDVADDPRERTAWDAAVLAARAALAKASP